MLPQEQGKAGLPDITDMEQQHREEVQRLTEEYSQEIERIRCVGQYLCPWLSASAQWGR